MECNSPAASRWVWWQPETFWTRDSIGTTPPTHPPQDSRPQVISSQSWTDMVDIGARTHILIKSKPSQRMKEQNSHQEVGTPVIYGLRGLMATNLLIERRTLSYSSKEMVHSRLHSNSSRAGFVGHSTLICFGRAKCLLRASSQSAYVVTRASSRI